MTNKMNVGVRALTFRSEKRHVCTLFLDVCIFILQKIYICFLALLLCFETEQNLIRIPFFFYFFFVIGSNLTVVV